MRGLCSSARPVAVAAAFSLAWFLVASEPAAAKLKPLPGAAPYPAALQGELARALAAKGRSYEPHTRHLNADGSPKYVNRLIRESSPYLLQHAHNPVNWYPWGDEAFERARREKKPVLLSVGYSTCHWCHVMEEESFEDLEIATFINAHYVAIKVDRERRPDVDGIYMAAVRLLSGRGGWPMTVWLTPDRKPFYGGTYFPARDGDRGARAGFLTLLRRLDQLYRKQPDQVASTSVEIAERLRKSLAAAPGQGLPTAAVLRKAYGHYRGAFDERDGGFGRAPKFPRSVELEFLLRYHRRAGDAQALRMVERTLEAMAAGGVYDQVGGGFHRYSTDAHWLVPHFEKMLYDNALLVVAYLEAYQATERPEFARVAREILAYVEREMTDSQGGFYSATDADSDGEEGKFFVWTPAELAALLTPEQRGLATAYYGVTERGNFEGKNILHIARPLSDVAAELGLELAKADALLQDVRARLYEARKKRVPPHTDRKILTSWNGLMISAFARAAQVFGESSYARTAVRAAEFVEAKMQSGGRLRRSYLDGRVSGDGFLQDYAFLTSGLLDLYEATFDPRWMRRAVALQKVLDEHFVDAGGGGYFLTSDDHEKLLAREKPSYDGAEPSGNSVALQNLLRLYEFTGSEPYRKRAEQALRGFQPTLTKYPSSVPKMLTAVDFWLDGAKEIAIVTPGSNMGAEAEPFLSRLRGAFLPNRVVAVVSAGKAQQDLAKTVPLVAGKPVRGGRATAYVCERQVCDLPTTDPAVFARQIAKVRALQ